MKKETKGFEVTLNNATGTLNTELFKKMCAKGDVTSISITELVGCTFTPQGDANCHIKTSDREFDRTYIDTVEYGIIHTASPTFLDGYADYSGECDAMRIVTVKAKLGTCYKCVPVFNKVHDEFVTFEE